MKAVKALGWALVLVGVWTVLAPFVWGYAAKVPVAQSVVLGVSWAAFGLWIALTEQPTAVALLGWLSALLGVGLIFAPALAGYSQVSAAFWNDVLVGFMAMVLGAWAAFWSREMPEPQAPVLAPHHHG